MDRAQTKKRAVIFSTVYYPFASGAEIAVKEITDRLPEYDWHLITAQIDPTLPRQEEIGRVVVHRVGIGSRTGDKFLLPITGFLKARALLAGQPVALLWSMMASQSSVAAAFVKMWYPQTRLVLTLQEGDEEEYLMRYVGGNRFLYSLFVRPWHRLVFRKADCITALSEHLARRARMNNPCVPVFVIPNGVDFSVFKKVQPTQSGTTILIHTGRLVEKNDPESVIRALPLLPVSVHFWLIGDGVLRQYLQELATKLGVSDRVFFLGPKTHPEMAELFTKAHIFIRPSLTEGLGSSFLEAMAAGLPIIATPVGGIPDFLTDGETGLFSSVKDPESIARAVRRLIDDPLLYSRIRETGFALAHERYDWMRVARDMETRAFACTPRMPRVLVAAAIYPPDPGGPATHAWHAVHDLPQHAVRTRLVSFKDARHFPRGIRHVVYLVRLLRAAREADVIFAYDAVSAGFAARVAARITGKPFMVRIGGDRLWEWAFERGVTREPLESFYKNGSYKKTFLFWVIRWVLRGVDLLLVPSETTAHLYRNYYDIRGERIRVIFNPASKKEVPGIPVSPPILLFVSRLVKYKNLPFVLRSLAVLKNEGCVFRFIILGDGPEMAHLKRLVDDLQLHDVVDLPGYVDQKEVEELTEKAYLTIAPALTEFHPNYVLTGISHGKPFLITRGHALPFSVPDIFLVNPQDHTEFESKLRTLLTSEGYARANEALRGIQFSYSWEDNMRETALCIKKLCGF